MIIFRLILFFYLFYFSVNSYCEDLQDLIKINENKVRSEKKIYETDFHINNFGKKNSKIILKKAKNYLFLGSPRAAIEMLKGFKTKEPDLYFMKNKILFESYKKMDKNLEASDICYDSLKSFIQKESYFSSKWKTICSMEYAILSTNKKSFFQRKNQALAWASQSFVDKTSYFYLLDAIYKAIFFLNLGEIRDADYLISKAIENSSKEDVFRIHADTIKSICLFKLGKKERSKELFIKKIDNFKEDKERYYASQMSMYLLSTIYALDNDFKKSSEIKNELNIDLFDSELKYSTMIDQSKVYYLLGDFKSSLKYYEKFFENNKNNLFYRLNHIKFNLKIQNFEDKKELDDLINKVELQIEKVKKIQEKNINIEQVVSNFRYLSSVYQNYNLSKKEFIYYENLLYSDLELKRNLEEKWFDIIFVYNSLSCVSEGLLDKKEVLFLDQIINNYENLKNYSCKIFDNMIKNSDDVLDKQDNPNKKIFDLIFLLNKSLENYKKNNNQKYLESEDVFLQIKNDIYKIINGHFYNKDKMLEYIYQYYLLQMSNKNYLYLKYGGLNLLEYDKKIYENAFAWASHLVSYKDKIMKKTILQSLDLIENYYKDIKISRELVFHNIDEKRLKIREDFLKDISYNYKIKYNIKNYDNQIIDLYNKNIHEIKNNTILLLNSYKNEIFVSKSFFYLENYKKLDKRLKILKNEYN